MYEVKTKLKGEQLINYFYDSIEEVLKSKGISEIKREKIKNEIGLMVAAKIEGKQFNPKDELVFENVERAEIKKRLTHKQRLELFQLEAMLAVIESFSKQFDKDCILDKETAKYVKTALSYLEKAINKVLGEIDEEEKRKYQRWVKKFRIAFLDTEKIIDRDAVRKLEQFGDKYILTEEEFLNLAEHAIEISCRGCNKDNYKKECRFYKTMYELDVDPQNFGDGCPYRMEDIK